MKNRQIQFKFIGNYTNDSSYIFLFNPSFTSWDSFGNSLSINSLHHISWYLETSSPSFKPYLFSKALTWLINLFLFAVKSKSLCNWITLGGIIWKVFPISDFTFWSILVISFYRSNNKIFYTFYFIMTIILFGWFSIVLPWISGPVFLLAVSLGSTETRTAS